MEQACDPGGRPELWAGAVAWTLGEAGWQAWRLPPEDEATAYAPTLYDRARNAAGVRFAATVRAARLSVEVVAVDAECSPLDVCVDGSLVRRQPVTGVTTVEVDLPDATCRVEVWLPQFGAVGVRSVQLHDAETVGPAPRGPRWVTYGSSITQCRTAAGPSETWPALAARALGWDLTCLGFGGNCHLDPVAARTIDGLEAEVVSLCLGINIYGNSSFGERTLPGQLAEFVRRVRESHPAADLVLISPIASPERETTPNDVGLTLGQIREMVHRLGDDLRRRGDARLHLVDGRTVLGKDDAHLLGDGLHPDADGYRLMAERLARKFRSVKSAT